MAGLDDASISYAREKNVALILNEMVGFLIEKRASDVETALLEFLESDEGQLRVRGREPVADVVGYLRDLITIYEAPESADPRPQSRGTVVASQVQSIFNAVADGAGRAPRQLSAEELQSLSTMVSTLEIDLESALAQAQGSSSAVQHYRRRAMDAEKELETLRQEVKRFKEQHTGQSEEHMLEKARQKIVDLEKRLEDGATSGQGEKQKKVKKEKVEKTRYNDGIDEVELDKGWFNFFEGATSTLGPIPTMQKALGDASLLANEYVVCSRCCSGIRFLNEEKHRGRCKQRIKEEEGGGIEYLPMTAEWAADEAKKKTGDEFIVESYCAVYSLESPLCYTANAAMRGLAFRGEYGEWNQHKDFAYCLHRALLSLPPFAGTVYRGMGFKVSEALYCPGAVITMPHPTSTSESPDSARVFLGEAGSGTLLVMRVKTGRRIREFSRFPKEEEVVMPANTQFRVVGRPGPGVVVLLETVLDLDLSNVVVVEMEEIDFFHWGQLEGVMTYDERSRNKDLLTAVEKLRGRGTWKRHPCTEADMLVDFPTTRTCPKVEGKTLLELALSVPGNERVVSLCLANLKPGRVLDEALKFTVELEDSQQRIALLLTKGATPKCLAEKEGLLTIDCVAAACSCRVGIAQEIKSLMGDSFWEQKKATGWTVLHGAAELDREELLTADRFLSGPLAPDVKDTLGRTPAHVAAVLGRSEALRKLA
eukprot:Hpha_TRINITY_DN29933_c0_g1::TRINITY_DN29933_c0_g1_i1::g.131878::m.131878